MKRIHEDEPYAQPRDSLRVAVAQIGARRHYSVPRALHAAGLLSRLYTDLHAGHPVLRGARRVLPRPLWSGALRRAFGRAADGLPPDRVSSFPAFALFGRGGASKSGDRAGRLRHWARRNERFGRAVVRRGLGDATCVYAFNAAALEVFGDARARGWRTILDQTAAPWSWDERLLAAERERWPGWEHSGVAPEDWAELSRRETEEWALADVVVCGSEYVRETVDGEGGPGDRCRVVPYACNVTRPVPERTGRSRRRLRLLFVGTLELRKGVPYLLEAARRLRSAADIRCVGPAALTATATAEVGETVEWVGAVPRAEVSEHYAWADAFVLPAVSEGSANVCYEALAAGLPVVTTTRAGSIVKDGVEGRIVPPGSVDELVQAIEDLAADRDTCESMGRAARATAERQTWADYVSRLAAAVTGDSEA